MLASRLPHRVKGRLAPSSVYSPMLLYHPYWLPLGGLPSNRSPSSINLHHFAITMILKENLGLYGSYRHLQPGDSDRDGGNPNKGAVKSVKSNFRLRL